MNRWYKGFTLTEVIVIVAVLGILATITAVGFTKYQQDARDARRISSITAIAEALEKYHENNGEYPSCEAIQQSGITVSSQVLDIQASSLLAPGSPQNETNSLKCDALSFGNDDFFEYEGDGSPDCLGGGSCLSYILKYKSESDKTVKSLASRHKTPFDTSGIPQLSVASTTLSSINLGWTSVPNASSYVLQRATNSSFTNNLTSSTIAGLSTIVSGLQPSSTYYFRIQAKSGESTTAWSTSLTASTLPLQPPGSFAATSVSNSQINLSWNTAPNTTSYTIDYSTASDFATKTTLTGVTGTSRQVTGLSTGITYYFRIKSINGAFESPWSSTVNATTTVPTPTCTSSVLNNNSQITVSWDAVTAATSYTLEYASNSGFSGATAITGITTTSRAVTGLLNGTTYYFRVKALNGSSESGWGSCPSRATGINGPTGYGWYAEPYAVRARAGLPWMPGGDPGYGSTFWTNGMTIYGSCSPGATIVTRLYSYYAYSNNTSPNNATLMDWTWNNQSRYVVGGSGSWWVWWQGWVACQVGSTRVGDVYLGNAGPY